MHKNEKYSFFLEFERFSLEKNETILFKVNPLTSLKYLHFYQLNENHKAIKNLSCFL